MNALDLLIADHNRVRGLFARFVQAQEADDSGLMAELASTIFEELTVHTTIEEEIFYPAIHDRDDDTAESVDEGVEEHHVVKVLMEEIEQLEAGSAQWVAKMTVLIENVEHHADEEETDMFPPLRQALAPQMEAMADDLEARKAELGAPVVADKIDLTKAELLELAQEQAIPGRSAMSQQELAATVAPA